MRGYCRVQHLLSRSGSEYREFSQWPAHKRDPTRGVRSLVVRVSAGSRRVGPGFEKEQVMADLIVHRVYQSNGGHRGANPVKQ